MPASQPANFNLQEFTDNGSPLAGGRLYTLFAGTTTFRAAFTDAAGLIPHTYTSDGLGGYYIALNARGELPTSIYFAAGAYDLALARADGSTVWTRTVAGVDDVANGILASIVGPTGASKIGFLQAGTGAVLSNVQTELRSRVSLAQFGAVGDGVTDDTLALQKAVAYVSLPGSPKELLIPYGVAGAYKITAATTVTNGGFTIRWENNSITLKKYFNGEFFIIRAGQVKLINPGMDGNAGGGFTGGGVRYGPSTQFTYDCVIEDPRIVGTKDSCLLFEGPRGAAGIMARGGTLLTDNPGSVSSGGYPSIRVVGPKDNDVSNRTFIGVTSSSQPLIDVTGMAVTKISNCFTGTIFFKGNPDVTGVGVLPYDSCIEVFIDNTYIRDGMTISGSEVLVNNSLTHGQAPVYTGAYGSAPTSNAAYGWKLTSDTIACRIGATNYTSFGVLDESPNGLAIENQCSSFSYGRAMVTGWTAPTTNPTIGNGSVLSVYDTDYKTINFRLRMTTGTTTTRGVGRWSFDLPFQVSLAAPPIGLWMLTRPSLPTLFGIVQLTDTSSTHRISMADSTSASGYIDDLYPTSIPAGSQLSVDFSYSRG